MIIHLTIKLHLIIQQFASIKYFNYYFYFRPIIAIIIIILLIIFNFQLFNSAFALGLS